MSLPKTQITQHPVFTLNTYMSKEFKIYEYDVVYLSYDEPNAQANWEDLLTKIPYAKRVHGVKGSDAAHKAAGELSETDYVITVDGDTLINLPHEQFFKTEIPLEKYRPNTVFSYNSINIYILIIQFF